MITPLASESTDESAGTGEQMLACGNAHAAATAGVGRIGTYEHDARTGRSIWSRGLKAIVGTTAKNPVDPEKELLPRVHPEDRAAFQDALSRAFGDPSAGEHDIEYRILRDDGTVRWLRDTGCVIFCDRDGERRPVRAIGSVIDLTAQKLTEASARDQQRQIQQALARSQAIFRQMTEGLIIFDADGVLVDMNPAALAIHGVDSAEAVRLQVERLGEVFELSDLDGRPLDTDAWPIARALRGEHFIGLEFRVRRRDTGHSWIGSYGGTPVFGADGKLELAIVTLRDVTAHKEAEAALARAKARIELALTATEVGLWHWEVRQDRVFADTNLLQLFGLDGEERELPLGAFLNCVHPDDRERIKQGIDAAASRAGPYQEEYRVVHPNGKVRWIHARGRAESDPRGISTTFPGVAVDITERRAAEQALEESRKLLRTVTDTVPDPFFAKDREGRMLLANPATLAAIGKPADEVLGHTDTEWMTCAPEQAEAIMAHDRQVMTSGQTETFEEWVGQDDDLRPFVGKKTPIRNAAGEMIGLVGVFRDVTEERRAQQQLKAADRRKDEFLATLAHELRNPLAPIRTGVELLQQRQDDSEIAKRVLAMMNRQLTHLVRLVDDLLDVSRVSRGKITLHKEPLDLGKVIESALEMSETELRRGDRQLSVTLPPEALPVHGDRVRLVQVIANLLNNAAKFTGDRGEIELVVERQRGQVQVIVRDDGVGIPPERIAEVFEVFSQLQAGHGGGLGIGLTLVQRLVEMHGGTVSAHSDGPGHGAEFVLTLPLRESASSTRRAATPVRGSAGSLKRRRILVVDDNKDIADALGLLLEALGAETIVVYGGADALVALSSFRPEIMLADIGMPEMDGYELARQVRAQRPDAQPTLVAVTGWGADEDRRRVRDAGFDHHLVKPVGAAQLKAVLCGEPEKALSDPVT